MFARRIAVIGTGYVGLTTGACLASLGHRVVCADVDEAKVARLCRGEVDILEPGLPELVGAGLASGRLSFVLGARTAIAELDGGAEVVFLCVPTPMGVGGMADLGAVESVVDEVRDLLSPNSVVVNKSTVPVGTAERTAEPGRLAVRQARRADGAHRRGQRRAGQVRGQLLPGDEAVLHQRGVRAV